MKKKPQQISHAASSTETRQTCSVHARPDAKKTSTMRIPGSSCWNLFPADDALQRRLWKPRAHLDFTLCLSKGAKFSQTLIWFSAWSTWHRRLHNTKNKKIQERQQEKRSWLEGVVGRHLHECMPISHGRTTTVGALDHYLVRPSREGKGTPFLVFSQDTSNQHEERGEVKGQGVAGLAAF